MQFHGPVLRAVHVPRPAVHDERLGLPRIEHVGTGKTVWEMTPQQTEYAGGDRRNRKAVARLTLEPGEYRLRYVSNSSHAYPDWLGAPPERERFYGVTVFNMTALPLIEKRLELAEVPGL